MARLAQLVERKALNLVVVGSSPTVGVLILGTLGGASEEKTSEFKTIPPPGLEPGSLG